MPYIDQPPWLKYTLRVLLAALYADLFWMGFLTFFDPNRLLWFAGGQLCLAALAAAVGGATARYRWEWPGTMGCVAGLSFAVWASGMHWDPVVFWTVIALILALLVRFVYLEKERGKARRIHDVSTRLEALEARLETGE